MHLQPQFSLQHVQYVNEYQLKIEIIQFYRLRRRIRMSHTTALNAPRDRRNQKHRALDIDFEGYTVVFSKANQVLHMRHNGPVLEQIHPEWRGCEDAVSFKLGKRASDTAVGRTQSFQHTSASFSSPALISLSSKSLKFCVQIYRLFPLSVSVQNNIQASTGKKLLPQWCGFGCERVCAAVLHLFFLYSDQHSFT